MKLSSGCWHRLCETLHYEIMRSLHMDSQAALVYAIKFTKAVDRDEIILVRKRRLTVKERQRFIDRGLPDFRRQE